MAAGFLPASGPIQWLHWPAGVRIDTGVSAGDAVSPYYDPMIAKLIAHAPSRSEAFASLADALAAELGPLRTTARCCCACAKSQSIGHGPPPSGPFPPTLCPSRRSPGRSPPSGSPVAARRLPWQQAAGFRLGPTRSFSAAVRIGEEARVLTLVERAGSLLWQGEQIPFELGADQIRLQQAGSWRRYPLHPRRGRLSAATGGQAHPLLGR